MLFRSGCQTSRLIIAVGWASALPVVTSALIGDEDRQWPMTDADWGCFTSVLSSKKSSFCLVVAPLRLCLDARFVKGTYLTAWHGIFILPGLLWLAPQVQLRVEVRWHCASALHSKPSCQPGHPSPHFWGI